LLIWFLDLDGSMQYYGQFFFFDKGGKFWYFVFDAIEIP